MPSTTPTLSTPTRVKFTPARIAAFSCPDGRAQAFMWDVDVPGLALRATARGAKAFVVERKLGRRTMRMTIGSSTQWPLETIHEGHGATKAIKQYGVRAEARRLLGLIDAGKDPRQEKAAAIALDKSDRAATKAERLRHEATGLLAWAAYRNDKAARWGELSRRDNEIAIQAGGEPRKRAKAKKTQPGPLFKLLSRPLAQVDVAAVSEWVKTDTVRRPTVTAKHFRLLRAFINWCSEHDDYKLIVQRDACKAKKTRQLLQKPKAKQDSLEREQLAVWFAAVRKQTNPVIAAYLQALLLTGARREELLSLRWDDVDFQWNRIELKDKVEGQRVIPLTPYVSSLLAGLPKLKQNPWIFSSPSAKSGRLQEPRLNHNKALTTAGLPHVTLHGLRRSFGSLSEWVEIPVGIVAQIQGHKPSAIAEKHYRVRAIDLLRSWHAKFERWMLEEAGVPFEFSQTAPSRLQVVRAA